MVPVLVIVLILVLLGDIPAWQHSRAWGWSVGLVGLVLIIVPILALLGRF